MKGFIALKEKIERLLWKLAKECSTEIKADPEDIVSVLNGHLWQEYKNGELQGKTISYIYQNCWYYIKNYIRINKKDALSLTVEPVHQEGSSYLDSVAEENNEELNIEAIDMVEAIKKSGLSPKEREVFVLMRQGFAEKQDGFTMREIAARMNISHVRVYKIQKNLTRKIKSTFAWLTVN